MSSREKAFSSREKVFIGLSFVLALILITVIGLAFIKSIEDADEIARQDMFEKQYAELSQKLDKYMKADDEAKANISSVTQEDSQLDESIKDEALHDELDYTVKSYEPEQPKIDDRTYYDGDGNPVDDNPTDEKVTQDMIRTNQHKFHKHYEVLAWFRVINWNNIKYQITEEVLPAEIINRNEIEKGIKDGVSQFVVELKRENHYEPYKVPMTANQYLKLVPAGETTMSLTWYSVNVEYPRDGYMRSLEAKYIAQCQEDVEDGLTIENGMGEAIARQIWFKERMIFDVDHNYEMMGEVINDYAKDGEIFDTSKVYFRKQDFTRAG